MTGNETTEPAPAGDDQDLPLQQQPDDLELGDEPGYLVTSGEAVGDDGSVVPIIGGLPAAEGSAWDIGAAADERGTLPGEG